LRAFVARALAQDGHEVVATADGGEALDVLTRDKGRFDLLLTDIRMPVMDGIALALAAARDYPELMILLMTGYADQRERAHGLDALIHDVIAKPFSRPSTEPWWRADGEGTRGPAARRRYLPSGADGAGTCGRLPCGRPKSGAAES
jgi:CheY-like chemotaxis protein